MAAEVSEREQAVEAPELPEPVESCYSDWTWEDDMYLHGYDWDGAPATEWYYRASDAQPGATEPKPLPSWPDSLSVVEFSGLSSPDIPPPEPPISAFMRLRYPRRN